MDNFNLRKKNQLEKEDRSSIGDWDEKTRGLCKKINLIDDFYTTSSCSGRVVLIRASEKKQENLFLFVSHNLISFNQLKKELENIQEKGMIYFKQEPCLVVVACKNLEDAQDILDLAKNAGWKKCGIEASRKRFVVELMNSDKLEFPIMNKGKVLVDDDYLKLVVDESNLRLKRSWEKIEKFEEFISNLK